LEKITTTQSGRKKGKDRGESVTLLCSGHVRRGRAVTETKSKGEGGEEGGFEKLREGVGLRQEGGKRGGRSGRVPVSFLHKATGRKSKRM